MQTDANLSWAGLRVRDFLSGERRFRCFHNECFHLDPPCTVWLIRDFHFVLWSGEHIPSSASLTILFAFGPRPGPELSRALMVCFTLCSPSTLAVSGTYGAFSGTLSGFSFVSS